MLLTAPKLESVLRHLTQPPDHATLADITRLCLEPFDRGDHFRVLCTVLLQLEASVPPFALRPTHPTLHVCRCLRACSPSHRHVVLQDNAIVEHAARCAALYMLVAAHGSAPLRYNPFLPYLLEVWPLSSLAASFICRVARRLGSRRNEHALVDGSFGVTGAHVVPPHCPASLRALCMWPVTHVMPRRLPPTQSGHVRSAPSSAASWLGPRRCWPRLPTRLHPNEPRPRVDLLHVA